jgi:hypothetical protein
MAEVTLNGSAVTRATIHLPRIGVWCADVDVDTETAPTGRVSIVADGGPTWVGTVVSGAVTHGLWRGRIVGGAGGLRNELLARAYRSATLSDVLADLLTETGETLAPDTASTSTSVPLYHRAKGTGAQAVTELARVLGYAWRVTVGGLLWLGTETWPDATATDVTLLERDPMLDTYTLGGESLSLAPGQLVPVRDEAGDVFVRAGDVRHEIEPDRTTTTVWSAA